MQRKCLQCSSLVEGPSIESCKKCSKFLWCSRRCKKVGEEEHLKDSCEVAIEERAKERRRSRRQGSVDMKRGLFLSAVSSGTKFVDSSKRGKVCMGPGCFKFRKRTLPYACPMCDQGLWCSPVCMVKGLQSHIQGNESFIGCVEWEKHLLEKEKKSEEEILFERAQMSNLRYKLFDEILFKLKSASQGDSFLHQLCTFWEMQEAGTHSQGVLVISVPTKTSCVAAMQALKLLNNARDDALIFSTLSPFLKFLNLSSLVNFELEEVINLRLDALVCEERAFPIYAILGDDEAHEGFILKVNKIP